MLFFGMVLMGIVTSLAFSQSKSDCGPATKGHSIRRMRRAYYLNNSLINYGVRITKALLWGAKSIKTKGTTKQIYTKGGGMEGLKRDFYRFNPRDIQIHESSTGERSLVGKVADRIFIRRPVGEDGLPTLEILKAEDYFERVKTGKKFSELEREVIIYVD